MPHLLTNLQLHVKIDQYANAVFTRLCLCFPLRLHHIICPEQICENLIFRAWFLFPPRTFRFQHEEIRENILTRQLLTSEVYSAS